MIYIPKGKLRYLFLLPIIILISFTGYFYQAHKLVYEMLINEKYIDRQFVVDIACDEIDRIVTLNPNFSKDNYITVLRHVAEEIDNTYGSYGELFDHELNSQSTRNHFFADSPLKIFDHSEIVNAVSNAERGKVVLWYNKPSIPQHYLYIYFRWVPTDSENKDKLLLIVGVSKYSVNSKIGVKMIYGTVALIIISTIFVTAALIILLERRARRRI